MGRRRNLLLAFGAAAGAAGLGVSLWRQHAGSARRQPPPGLWELKLPQPGGGQLNFAALRGKPILLNFWATWCVPCIREMPEIDRFAQESAPMGWQVVGIAVDQENPVREFLSRRPVSYSIALAGAEGIELGRSLGNEVGALPYTVAISAGGLTLATKLGETRLAEMRGWAAAAQPGPR